MKLNRSLLNVSQDSRLEYGGASNGFEVKWDPASLNSLPCDSASLKHLIEKTVANPEGAARSGG